MIEEHQEEAPEPSDYDQRSDVEDLEQETDTRLDPKDQQRLPPPDDIGLCRWFTHRTSGVVHVSDFTSMDRLACARSIAVNLVECEEEVIDVKNCIFCVECSKALQHPWE